MLTMASIKLYRNNVTPCMLAKYLKKPKISYESSTGAFKLKSNSCSNLLCSRRFQHSKPTGTSLALKEKLVYSKESKYNSPENKFVEMRTHTCGSLRERDVGSNVRICGWLQFSRLSRFAVLRDGYGTTQVIIPDERKDLHHKISEVPFESVLAVKGHVIMRPAGQENPKMSTGSIEVLADEITILNPAKKDLPFSIREYNKAKESLQMKYRYLSLRFPELQHNLRLRSHILNHMREYLINRCAFVEVETPTLFRKTPGGAQEFVVPTQQPGHFYSLVQSPQQLKQLLMVGAIDRYFQVARCYRDETARPDRQPEFTQMDIEMSFSNREGVMNLVEDLLEHSWHSAVDKTNHPPFPRISYNEAISTYGSDKPDTRFELKLIDVTGLLVSDESVSKFLGLLKQHSSFVAVCFVIPKNLDQGLLSRTNFKRFEEALRKSLIKMSSVRFLQEKVNSNIVANDLRSLQEHLSVDTDDWIITAIGEKDEVLSFLGRLRLKVADHLESKGVKVRSEGFNFLWVEDFPLFLPSEESNKEVVMESAHHPFTQPHPDDLHLLELKPLKVRGLHYDLVCNGCEVGGGSVRVHDAALQCSILETLGIDKRPLFHLIEALSCGCPPHAGIALGIDRLIALAVGANSVREVMAFPKGSDGQDIMSGAPSHLAQQELDLYHLRIKE